MRMKGQTSLMPLNGKMGHVEIKRSQKLVLDVLVAVIVDVPMARAGIETTAPIGPEAATAATATPPTRPSDVWGISSLLT